MSEKIKNSPKLRFPEFVNDKDWEEKVLGSKDVSHSISSGKDKNDSNGKFDLYGSTGIIGKSLNGSYSGNFILVARVGANAGFLTKVNGRFGVTDNTLVVDLHKAVNIDFIFSSLEIFRLNKLVFGSGQPLITGGQLKAISIFLPKPKEQQKIADCLSSVDSLILAQSQKVELLKKHKKGLMQHLFPQDGEEVPKLRFPEFKNATKWEEKEVGEIFQVTRGYVLSMSLVADKQTEQYIYPVYSSQTKNNGLAGYYPEYLYEDAITWTTDGANAGDVNYRKGKFYCTNVCGVLLNNEGYANACIAEIINSVSKNYVSYVGNPKLMNGIMSKIPIKVPSLKEQQKIADCLNSLDEQISQQTTKLQTLKEHKKALMQQLFPHNKEITNE